MNSQSVDRETAAKSRLHVARVADGVVRPGVKSADHDGCAGVGTADGLLRPVEHDSVILGGDADG